MNCFPMMTRQCQPYVLVITTLLLLSGLIEMSYSSSLESALFVRLRNFDGYLHTKNNLTSLTPIKSKSECALLCIANPECGSFFYLDNPQKVCQTHSVLFMTTDQAMVTPSASYYQLTQARCPHEKGYILYRPVPLCYKYFIATVTGDQANKNCQANQTHLIDVKNPVIFKHLTSVLKASPIMRRNYVSVGGSLINKVWYWSDGEPITWIDWLAGDPNFLATEHCLYLDYKHDLKFINIQCSRTAYQSYICQLNI